MVSLVSLVKLELLVLGCMLYVVCCRLVVDGWRLFVLACWCYWRCSAWCYESLIADYRLTVGNAWLVVGSLLPMSAWRLVSIYRF